MTTVDSTEDLRSSIQDKLDASPFIRFLGLRCDVIDTSTPYLEMTMPYQPALGREATGDQFHGGTLASFIDTAADFLVVAMTDRSIPTVNIRIDYLRAAVGKHVTAQVHMRRLGRTLAVVDVDVLDDQKRTVAIGRGTFAVPANQP
jgi:uncharacterized protein (TIGR00369 family)